MGVPLDLHDDGIVDDDEPFRVLPPATRDVDEIVTSPILVRQKIKSNPTSPIKKEDIERKGIYLKPFIF